MKPNESESGFSLKQLDQQLERASREIAAIRSILDGGLDWISVNRRTPEIGVAVWCYWPGSTRGKEHEGMQGVAVRSYRTWHAEGDRDDWRFTPTHWRPLPPAPSAPTPEVQP